MSGKEIYKQSRVRKWLTLLSQATCNELPTCAGEAISRRAASSRVPEWVFCALRDARVYLRWDPDSTWYHKWEHLTGVASKVFPSAPISVGAGLLSSRKDLDSLAMRYAALFHDYGYDPAVDGQKNIEVAVHWMRLTVSALWPEVMIKSSPSIQFPVRKNGEHMMSLLDFELMLDEASSVVEATRYRTKEDLTKAGVLGASDLAVLTCGDQASYGEYSHGVRSEYRSVPDYVYAPARLAALNSLVPLLVPDLTGGLGPLLSEIKTLEKATRSQRRRLLLPGLFDPIHKGHLKSVRMAVREGHNIIIGVYSSGLPGSPPAVLSQEERVNLVASEIAAAGISSNVSVVPIYENNGINEDVSSALSLGCDGVLSISHGSFYSGGELVKQDSRMQLRSEYGTTRLLCSMTNRDRRTRDLSSAMIKEQVRMFMPAKGVTSRVRAVLEKRVSAAPLLPVLVAGGICTGKSTLCSGRYGSLPTIDMDSLGAQAMSMAGLGGLTRSQVLERFYRTPDRYKNLMDRIRPGMLALLCSLLQKTALVHRDEGVVLVQVNKLGLLWSDLLRVAGGRVILMDDIGDDEAEARLQKRGSSADTMRAVRKLEATLALGLEKLEKKGVRLIQADGAAELLEAVRGHG